MAEPTGIANAEHDKHGMPKAIILFYKYAALSDDKEKMSILQDAFKTLCSTLNLTGRILLGISADAEGINGTLSGAEDDLEACTIAMLGRGSDDRELDNRHRKIAEAFWVKSEEFAETASVAPLFIDSKEDFKWSKTVKSNEDMFPDLNIKIVKEIISTGGKLSSVKLSETKKGYLSPEEWHEEIRKLISSKEGDGTTDKEDTILIDCRNHKEFEIGRFVGAMDPNTKTFEQFPRWVEQNRAGLQGKKVLMYCTGGIRCEKASAFIRKETAASSVQHLKGGIHKYLDKYGADGLFRGKNFVFDRRVGAEASSHIEGSNTISTSADTIVGRCLYCERSYDIFTPDGVCTVCREPTLVCDECRMGLVEYHCLDHAYLRNCYFRNLSAFKPAELKKQLSQLEKHLQSVAVGKRYKQKRKTLRRQCDRILAAMEGSKVGGGSVVQNNVQSQTKCRSCGTSACSGGCWGFHGLGRKDKMSEEISHSVNSLLESKARSTRASANQRSSKVKQRERDIAEIRALGLAAPPSLHRLSHSSLRCPPPFTRNLLSSVKGKWCGRSILDVLQSEFADLSDAKYLSSLMSHSLIRLNNVPVKCDAIKLNGDGRAVSASTLLKNMDMLSRTVHWHEPPVIVPPFIPIQKTTIPDVIVDDYCLREGDESWKESMVIYICDKPATVPVHPAGPYLTNSLTMMVEGQERLEPRSLRPCHRLDRCTSGLTICAASPAAAKLIQGRLVDRTVQKVYLARVKGKFPCSEDRHCFRGFEERQECPSASWTWKSTEDGKYVVEVNAPIENIDPMNGIRAIRASGKPSTSRFSLFSYDGSSDLSIVACYPVTGRGHQLRVHLQWLGHPIHRDVTYGASQSKSMGHKEEAVQALVDTSKSAEEAQSNPDISEDVARSAIELCRCCADGVKGIEASFSSAQLLGGGHAIDLHAWRYRVLFERKRKRGKRKRAEGGKSECADDSEGAPTMMDFATGVPQWAESCKVADVGWL